MTIKSGAELQKFADRPDMAYAVAKHAHGFRLDQFWNFWITDDPRAEEGLGIPLIASYRCIEGGSLELSQWESVSPSNARYKPESATQ